VLIRGAKSDSNHSAVAFFNAPKKNYQAQTAVVPGADGKSYTVEAAIPFEALGFTPTGGQEILFDLCVDDGGNGRRQLAWNGTARDSKDRGSWGRAAFCKIGPVRSRAGSNVAVLRCSTSPFSGCREGAHARQTTRQRIGGRHDCEQTNG